MARSVEELERQIHRATEPRFRSQLSARGLARNLIWSGGELPQGSPPFSPLLSSDLLSYGLALFELGLELRQQSRDNPNVALAFEHAGEAIESVVRDGDPNWNDRGFYTVVAAAAYHLGHFSARAFSLFPSGLETLNLSPSERTIAYLMRRDLDAVRSALFDWAGADGFDATLAGRLEQPRKDEDFDSGLILSLNSLFHKAIAHFDYALETGSAEAVNTALLFLDQGILTAAEFEAVPFWWVFTIARHLIDDLWSESLHSRLPNPIDDEPGSKWSDLRRLFIAELLQQERAEIDLWPSQLVAARRAFDMSDDLIAALPTSAGKTRIAEICILRAVSLGRRVLFVTPLRALSAQTERNVRRTFTPLGFSVSSLYGSSGTTGDDTDSLGNRDVVVTTPEKLDFALRNNPELIDDVGLIVLDEAHTIGAAEREVRYEVLVQRLLRRSDAVFRRIVCLSAILPTGDQLQDFVFWIRQDQEGEAITKDWRPTRQRFGEIFWAKDHARLTFRVEGETPFVDRFVISEPPRPPRRKSFPSGLQELAFASAWRLVDQGQTVLIYCPQRRSVNALAKTALTLHRQGLIRSLLKPDSGVLSDALTIGKEWLGEFHPAVECLKLGIAVHHAQLPRPFLRAVEMLLKDQALKVTIASPTLAQGLNLSATTVLFYSLMRGRETISGEEFANVAGRAGRAFVDVEGRVLCVATELKHLRKWNKILRAAKERDLRSGLFQLVQEFCVQLVALKGYSLDKIVEYVLGNSAETWDPPVLPKANDDEGRKRQEELERKWRADLACLDSALLSLVQQDVGLDDLARAIDTALHSSLWERTLRREDEATERLSKAILLGRAGFIWRNSTAAQRKGYFYAGVSFTTGRYLDNHADELNRLLQTADDSMADARVDSAIEAMIEFAKIAFGVDPFKPEKLPDTWEKIARAWVRGENMADLAGAKDAEMLEFVEAGLVYRLVWAMEAVRVRAVAVSGAEQAANRGRAALAIETGTSDRCAALLIQSGLASRIAATKAVRDCPADFHDLKGLRVWLRSEAVKSKQRDAQWPTAETANLWIAFVNSLERLLLKKWDVHQVQLPAVWSNGAPPEGSALRIFHKPEERQTTIYSVELDRLGSVTPGFSHTPAGVFLAKSIGSTNRIAVEYLGPDDLVKG